MTQLSSVLTALSLTLGVAWASGINLYAAVFTLGLLGANGYATLPANLAVIQHPLVITVSGVLFFVEFFADKIPGFDSIWDAVHTFIRIPAGAVLAAGAVGQVSPPMVIAAGLLGGGISAMSHATKAGSRVLINASPEPFTNWFASLTEDALVIGGILTAVHHPLVFLLLLGLFLVAAAWVLPRLFRLFAAGFGRLRMLFRRGAARHVDLHPVKRIEGSL